jgi:aspartate aminotransferase
MSTIQYSKRITNLKHQMSHVLRYITQSEWATRQGEPTINDLTLSNPQERPLPQNKNALKQWLEPRQKGWFAYKDKEPDPRDAVAKLWRGHYNYF